MELGLGRQVFPISFAEFQRRLLAAEQEGAGTEALVAYQGMVFRVDNMTTPNGRVQLVLTSVTPPPGYDMRGLVSLDPDPS